VTTTQKAATGLRIGDGFLRRLLAAILVADSLKQNAVKPFCIGASLGLKAKNK